MTHGSGCKSIDARPRHAIAMGRWQVLLDRVSRKVRWSACAARLQCYRAFDPDSDKINTRNCASSEGSSEYIV